MIINKENAIIFPFNDGPSNLCRIELSGLAADSYSGVGPAGCGAVSYERFKINYTITWWSG